HKHQTLSLHDALPIYDRTLFWRIVIQDAARMGKWKYLREGRNEHLFDLSVDPGEKNELKGRQPEVFEKICSEYQTWNSKMLPGPDRKSTRLNSSHGSI